MVRVVFPCVAAPLLLLLGGHAAPARPRFSWSTVPAFYHSGNLSGAYTDEAIRIIAKYPMVTIEKGQGVFDTEDHRFAEDKILDTLRRVKSVDPNVSTIFYLNSILDWPFYRLHEDLLRHPEWWLKNHDGSVCRLSGDQSFPNSSGMLSFDFTQAGARHLWVSACAEAARSGAVDGCFVDRAIDTPCGAGPAYQQGHVHVMQQAQAALGAGVLIANHAYDLPGASAAMIEYFAADEVSVLTLQAAAARGKIVQAHAGCSTGADITDPLAAFLVGAGPFSYFGCSSGWSVQSDPIEGVWRPEYDRPLGEPRGLAVKEGSVYRRAFDHPEGTTFVSFDVASNSGWIQWAADSPLHV